ncbi:DUF4177 domain-containing protein [Paenibacillus alvei]|uniref:DUF4177 domain-containing protein n=1 Tax=Paenibacillus alvei TaxID=44250 RepID=A0A383RCZ4_PAEAL|nr:DUF4177 domain-containing protein [Paenibacillus alvei]SYX84146.1 conserved protein of unknown function [Paenibacillus alvei]
MYTYHFEKVKIGLSSQKNVETKVQDIIHEHAKDGWRLVQVIPPYHGASTLSFEIIFEKKA